MEGKIARARPSRAAVFITINLQAKSEYFDGLSTEAKARYTRKIILPGLTIDPYCIREWTENPEIVPAVKMSNMLLYLVATPSPYTKEEIKVANFVCSELQLLLHLKGLESTHRWKQLHDIWLGAWFEASLNSLTPDLLSWAMYVEQNFSYPNYEQHYFKGKTFTKDICHFFTSMGNTRVERRNFNSTLHLYGWVSIIISMKSTF